MKSRLTMVFISSALVACALYGRALADECGQPPAYTADRDVDTPRGLVHLKVAVQGQMQREETSPTTYKITDFAAGKVFDIDLDKHEIRKTTMPQPPGAGGKPPKGKLPPKDKPYTDHRPLDGDKTEVEMGVVHDGKKIWISKTVCGGDAIFLKRTLMLPGPKGMITITISQSNIHAGDLPKDIFTVPDGLKEVKK